MSLFDLFARLEQFLGTVLSFYFELLTPILSNGWAYGVGIILLTISINVVVFPLTLKQTRATRAFTEIQPKIKKIQAEYKDDPQEMQRRLMETQKEAGATPGGCLLPLLVQMPIWFALFRLLRTPIKYILDKETNTMELNPGGVPIPDPEAIQPIDPFFSTLGKALHELGRFLKPDDLSPNNWVPGFDMQSFLGMNLGISPSEAMTIGLVVALPYLAMIVFMVATQYVQQWHSTYGQDRPDQKGAGAQQAITKIMPLFIGFISWNFPAGLVLYWSTSNLFRFGQQVLIFKIDGRPPPPSKAEPEPDQDDDSDGGKPGKAQPGAADKRRRRRRR